MICRYTANGNGTFSYKCRPEGLLFYAHRSFEPGKRAANIVLAVEGLLIVIFWTYTALMRKDFSKMFAAITLAPFTLRAVVLLIHTAIFHAMDFPDMEVIHGMRIAERVLETTGCFSFLIGSTVFSAMAVHTARVKRAPESWRCTSLPYVLTVLLVCILAILDVFPPRTAEFDYSNLSTIVFLAILSGSILIDASLFISMCVVNVVRCDAKCAPDLGDPVIVNARPRMFWTIPLMILACLAPMVDLMGNLSLDPYFSTISMSILPPFLLLSVFLLLPAYRTALFCCFANNRQRNKVAPLTIGVRPFSQSAESSLKN